MCSDGVILTDTDGSGLAVREQARAVLADGPPALEPGELDLRRYGLSDLLDDLAGSTGPGETAIICWNVLREAAELALLLDGCWLGSGKWLLRELRAAEPQLAGDLIDARDNPARLAGLADGVLAAAGGRLWAGVPPAREALANPGPRRPGIPPAIPRVAQPGHAELSEIFSDSE